MKKQPLIKKVYTSFDEMEDAYNKVRNELVKLGVLWDKSKLDKVEAIYLTIAPISALGGYMGFYQPAKKTIEFPSVYLPIEALWATLSPKASAVDVFRHEFGHALADLYPRALSQGGLFREAFGAKYGPDPAPEIDPDNWEFDCVSSYAAKKTQEDFAETFMLFVKHKGKMPRKFAGKPAIKKKWAAVAEIVKRVAAATK